MKMWKNLNRYTVVYETTIARKGRVTLQYTAYGKTLDDVKHTHAKWHDPYGEYPLPIITAA